MAIGKVNAFASVTAPQVDFGSVALNAQKFQQAADDEKLKMAISFKKAKDTDVKPLDLKGESTGHVGLDNTNSSILSEYQTQYYNLMKQGNLSEANEIQQKAFMAVSQMKEARNSINSYDEAVKKGEISPASFSYTEAMNAFLRNNYDSKVVNGEAVIIPYQTRSDGKPVYGEDGEKIPLKIVNAFGEEEPYLTLTSLNNWQAKIVQSVDMNKKAIEISKLLNLPTTKKEDGSVTIEATVLSDENKADIFDNVVKSLKTDRNFMINSAYKVSEDYKFPKKEYTEDDYKRVAEVVAGDIFPIYKQTRKETLDESGSGRSVKPGEKPLELNIAAPIQGTQTFSWRAPKSKRTQVGDFGSFELSINNTDQKQNSLQSVGMFTNTDKRAGSTEYFYIKVASRGSSSSGTGSGTARMGVGEGELTQQTIYFTGDADFKSAIQNYAMTILNPETGKYFKSAQDLFDYVKEQKKKFSGTQR